MPYVNVKILEDGVSREKKRALVRALTDTVSTVLGKHPASTLVVIDEVSVDHWGSGGQTVAERRDQT